MKRCTAFIMSVAIIAAFIVKDFDSAQAARPTVTMAKSTEVRTNTVVYTATFTGAIASVDTAILQKEANTPWYIGYMATKNNPDSVITLQYETTETTVDSCRKKFVFQVSYADSPTSWGPDDSWVNFYSVTADSSASDFVRFVPNRYGVPYKLRVLVIETDANKDAVQTSTVRIIFPKFADL